jgi:predicted naringenin-chalcone synthase
MKKAKKTSIQKSQSFYNFPILSNDMQILRLSTALPRDEYSTEELLDSFPCTLPEGVRQNVLNLGVSKRCLIKQSGSSVKSETVMSETDIVDLCSDACVSAVQEAGLSTKDVDYLITAYDANPFLSPGLGQLLVPELGLDPYAKHVNVQGIASTAFMKNLELAEDHLAMHPKDNVLICVSGVSSYWFQNQVRGLKEVMEIGQINRIDDLLRKRAELRKWVAVMQFFLFGDGAAAAVVVAKGDEGLSVRKIVEVTNIGKKDYLAGYARLSLLNEPFKFGFYSHLDKEIPKLGVKYTGLALEKLLGKDAGKTMKAAKRWAVHTGSEKILDALADHNGIDPEKLRESHQVLRECGNLAGASLPFILHRIVSTVRLSEKDIVLMLGYGWGFSASACLLESHEGPS